METECPCGVPIRVAEWQVRVGRGKYCSNDCKYKYRVRPKGLKYELTVDNRAWIKPGQRLSPDTEFQPGIRNNPNGEIRVGEHRGAATEYGPGEAHPQWKGGYYSRTYGVSQAEWDDQFDKQQGRCAICGAKPSLLDTDHDHDTGVVRGLLCGRCNKALGLFAEDVEVLQKAKEYIAAGGVWSR